MTLLRNRLWRRAMSRQGPVNGIENGRQSRRRVFGRTRVHDGVRAHAQAPFVVDDDETVGPVHDEVVSWSCAGFGNGVAIEGEWRLWSGFKHSSADMRSHLSDCVWNLRLRQGHLLATDV